MKGKKVSFSSTVTFFEWTEPELQSLFEVGEPTPVSEEELTEACLGKYTLWINSQRNLISALKESSQDVLSSEFYLEAIDPNAKRKALGDNIQEFLRVFAKDINSFVSYADESTRVLAQELTQKNGSFLRKINALSSHPKRIPIKILNSLCDEQDDLVAMVEELVEKLQGTAFKKRRLY